MTARRQPHLHRLFPLGRALRTWDRSLKLEVKMDSALLSMSEEDLLVQIGHELEKDEVQAFPQPVQVLRRRAERYLASKAAELRAAICPSKALRSLAEGGVTIDLAQAVLAAIE